MDLDAIAADIAEAIRGYVENPRLHVYEGFPTKPVQHPAVIVNWSAVDYLRTMGPSLGEITLELRVITGGDDEAAQRTMRRLLSAGSDQPDSIVDAILAATSDAWHAVMPLRAEHLERSVAADGQLVSWEALLILSVFQPRT